MSRKEQNREALEAVGQQNEFQKSIAQWKQQQHDANHFIARLIKKIKQRLQQKSAQFELFRDQFEFETGLDSRSKEGKAAFEQAVTVHVQRAMKKAEERLENEWESESPLSEFLDDEEAIRKELEKNL